MCLPKRSAIAFVTLLIGGYIGAADAPEKPAVIKEKIANEIEKKDNFGTLVLDFQAKKKTWHCPSFPMQEKKHPGGDPAKNLYAPDGPLAKLDKITDGKSCEYEFEHNRKAIDAGLEYYWWGHSNDSAEAACILLPPRQGVLMKGLNGEEVYFSIRDIAGLLVTISAILVKDVDYKGEHFDQSPHPNLSPELFLETLQSWAKVGLPFVLDIPDPYIHNYPIDSVKIFKSERPAALLMVPGLSKDFLVTHYHVNLQGTGYEKKNITYEMYVQRRHDNSIVTSGWLKASSTHPIPDFMWCPLPKEYASKTVWHFKPSDRPMNPKVDPQVIYDIYLRSLYNWAWVEH